MNRFWIGLTVVTVFAILMGRFFWKVKAEVQYGFDFGSIVDAIALLLVALIVEYAFSKHSADRSADTTTLLDIVEEARVALSNLAKSAETYQVGKSLTKVQMGTVTAGGREFSNSIHSIEVALRHCSIKPEDMKFYDLKEATFELNESLTNTPYPGPYDGGSVARIQKAFRVVRDDLTRIAIAINHRK